MAMSAALRIDAAADLAPRERLRAALAEQHRVTERMAGLARQRDEAEAKEKACQADLAAFDAAVDAQWGRWEADRAQPQPLDAARRRAELLAFRHAAAKAAEVARLAYQTAEERALRDLPLASAAIAEAVQRVVAELARDLGEQYRLAVEQAGRLEAALSGLKAAAAARLDGATVAAVQTALMGGQTADGAQRRRGELEKRNRAIKADYQRLAAERLTSDPDATVEETT